MNPTEKLMEVLISKEKQKQANRLMRIAEKIKAEVKRGNKSK